MDKKSLHKIAYYLVLIGALNWGLVGLLKINLVTTIFGGTGLQDLIYVLVGVGAVYLLINRKATK